MIYLLWLMSYSNVWSSLFMYLGIILVAFLSGISSLIPLWFEEIVLIIYIIFYIFPMCDLYSIMKFILVSVLSFRSKYILILLSEIVYKYQSVSWLMKTDRWFVIFTDFLSSWLITKTGNKVFNSNDEFGCSCSLSYQILDVF